jgi:S1-C subfamily serine protease
MVASHAVACSLIRADEPSPPSFQPGEISIGEPLNLPVARDPAPQADAEAPTPAVTENGWIGLTADDSVVTGRVVVVGVDARGPAARAGIKPDDQLLAINGTPLRTSDQLAAALAALSPGSAVKIAIGRADRIDEISLEAVPRPERALSREWQSADGGSTAPAEPVAATPPEPARLPPPRFAPPPSRPVAAVTPPEPSVAPSMPQPAAGRGRTALGVRTLPVDPNVQARFHLAEPAGALVIGVVQDLPASKAGVPPGSVIVAIDNQPVRSPNELTKLVTSSPVGTPVTLQYVLPGGESRRAEVSLQSLEVPLERALVGPDR